MNAMNLKYVSYIRSVRYFNQHINIPTPGAPGRLDHQESIDEPVPGVENWNPGPDVQWIARFLGNCHLSYVTKN